MHLGQMLVANGDIYIIDFEGEPARPVQERRAKTSRCAMSRVIRSLDYAAGVVAPAQSCQPGAVHAFLDTFSSGPVSHS